MAAVKSKNGAPLTFMELVEAETPGDSRLSMCIQCGTCGGSCPSGEDMEHSPRQLFAMIVAGKKDDVLHSNTPWYCVSCYYCVSRCPQEVHITDLMYSLKRMAIKEGHYQETSTPEAPDFSATFIDLVERHGRSFELGLATRHNLKHSPLNLVRMGTGMGLEMLRMGRMDLTPNKIQKIGQLQAILNKAKEIGGSA